MEALLYEILEKKSWLVYGVVFLGILLEGEISIFASFYFAQSGFLNPFAILPIAILTPMFGNVFFYKLGIFLEKFPFFQKKVQKYSGFIDGQLRRNFFKTFLVSKFTYGFHRLTLARVGAIGTPFKKYIQSDFLAVLIWVSVIGGLGFFSSLSLDIFKEYLKISKLAIFGIIFFLLISSGFLEVHIKKVFSKSK